MRKTYYEKLRDPRWQKRRLEILSGSDFSCAICQTSEDELHVHHLLYRKGKDPWEYSDFELLPLCAQCHKNAEESREDLLSILGRFPMEYPVDSLVKALRLILERDPWEIWNWFQAAKHPDLLEEAYQRMISENKNKDQNPFV